MKANFILLITSLTFLTLFLPTLLVAQPDPMKFGKVDKSLLEMQTYEKDTSASVVMLCEYGEFDVNSMIFVHQYRLKILKKAGCDIANSIVNINDKSDISGYTFNLVNGEVVKEKLKKESIFEEKVEENYYRYRLAMPNVQVGSVVDIKAVYQGIPMEWYFQKSIPVVWSELRLPMYSTLGISKNYFGFQPITINEENRWVCKDMPALETEPYMNDISNFLTKFQIDVTSYRGYSWASTWQEVSDHLLSRSSLGAQLKGGLLRMPEIGIIKDTARSNRSKVVAALEAVRKKVKWNQSEWLYPSEDFRLALNKGAGNSSIVNIALYLCLKKLDVQCYPVALSTRSNGMLPLFSPTIRKLNYLIVLAKVDGEDILLDATEEFLPAGYLPERCVNGVGRLIDDNIAMPVELKPGGRDKTRLYADLTLTEKGAFTGDLYYSYYEYAAYLFRKRLSGFNDKDEFVRTVEQKNPGLTVSQSTFSAVDSIYFPVNVKFGVESFGNADVSESTISFNPFIVDRIKVNPFKPEERKIPVDFIYSTEKKYIIKIKLPPGYVVSHLPAKVNMVLPDNGGRFTYSIAAQDDAMVIQSEISLNKALFTQAEYPSIKQLYANIIARQAEPVILIKK